MTLPSKSLVLRVEEVGLGLSLQDRGRLGWRTYGLPLSGCMDPHAALCANRLLDNSADSPVLEILLRGARLQFLQDVWIAICGAKVNAACPTSRAVQMKAGQEIFFQSCAAGLWSYLAVESGFAAPQFFGSASYYARGQVGMSLGPGSTLHRKSERAYDLPRSVAGRTLHWSDLRDYEQPPRIRLWRGPQWDLFTAEERAALLESDWRVSPRSDRVGYRLEGAVIKRAVQEMVSEPVRLGSIQVPPSGEPIITMPDGPTVGGYPKIALVDQQDLPWVAQSRPGQRIAFEMIDEAGPEL